MSCLNCNQTLKNTKISSEQVCELVKRNYVLPIVCAECQHLNYVKVNPEKCEQFLKELFEAIKPEDVIDKKERTQKIDRCSFCPNCCDKSKERVKMVIDPSKICNNLFDGKCPKCGWSFSNSFTPDHSTCIKCDNKEKKPNYSLLKTEEH